MKEPISDGNSRFLRSVCLVLPAAAMCAAHWFPWRRLLGRELHRVEAYAIGTAAIVGTSTAAIIHSEGDRNDHATMILLAAASAGIATCAAYAVDEITGLRADLTAQQAGKKAADELRQDGD